MRLSILLGLFVASGCGAMLGKSQVEVSCASLARSDIRAGYDIIREDILAQRFLQAKERTLIMNEYSPRLRAFGAWWLYAIDRMQHGQAGEKEALLRVLSGESLRQSCLTVPTPIK